MISFIFQKNEKKFDFEKVTEGGKMK